MIEHASTSTIEYTFLELSMFGSYTNLDLKCFVIITGSFLDHLASRARTLSSTAVTQQTGALRLA
jgi:hypothetical protein